MSKNPTVGMFVGDQEVERRQRRDAPEPAVEVCPGCGHPDVTDEEGVCQADRGECGHHCVFPPAPEQKPPHCTCRFPEVIARNMNGHDGYCPVYQEWERRAFPSQKQVKCAVCTELFPVGETGHVYDAAGKPELVCAACAAGKPQAELLHAAPAAQPADMDCRIDGCVEFATPNSDYCETHQPASEPLERIWIEITSDLHLTNRVYRSEPSHCVSVPYVRVADRPAGEQGQCERHGIVDPAHRCAVYDGIVSGGYGAAPPNNVASLLSAVEGTIRNLAQPDHPTATATGRIIAANYGLEYIARLRRALENPNEHS